MKSSPFAGLAMAAMLTTTFLASPAALADASEWSGTARDAWIDGKLEGSYLLNTELNNFRIATEVENGMVRLSGTVSNEAHVQLAERIAMNINGVESVDNQLSVDEAETGYEMDQVSRDFVMGFYDMTTTAGLKSEYAINDTISALDINIDTKDGIVTLSGDVDSEAEKQLAEEIARSYQRVSEVRNNLTVVVDAD